MKLVVGVLANYIVQKDGPFPGLVRMFVNTEYIDAIKNGGGIPVVIPILEDESQIEDLFRKVDAIVITGGNDVSPNFFLEEPMPKLGFITPDLDAFHLTAIRIAERLEKPMLGICRGLQLLNVAFGGTLYQDLAYREKETFKHWQESRRGARAHLIELDQQGSLHAIYGKEVMVNSFHHQCIKEMATGFTAIAHARDGVIEAIESEAGNYKLAVQWHPESMTSDLDHEYKVFELFFKKVKLSLSY